MIDLRHIDDMAHLRIKTAYHEIEIDSDNLAGDLSLVQSFLASMSSGQAAASSQTPPPSSASESFEPDLSAAQMDEAFQQGMNSYVAKFDADSARKIIEVAAYHLSLFDGLDAFPKDAIFARARQSREWKSDYTNQQSVAINRMVKAGELIERAGGLYSVPTKMLEAAKKVLLDD